MNSTTAVRCLALLLAVAAQPACSHIFHRASIVAKQVVTAEDARAFFGGRVRLDEDVDGDPADPSADFSRCTYVTTDSVAVYQESLEVGVATRPSPEDAARRLDSSRRAQAAEPLGVERLDGVGDEAYFARTTRAGSEQVYVRSGAVLFFLGAALVEGEGPGKYDALVGLARRCAGRFPSSGPVVVGRPPDEVTPDKPSFGVASADAKPGRSEGATTKPNPPSVLRVSGGVLLAKAVAKPQPPYPQIARAAGVEGAVVVEVTVDETGRVISARAISGHPLLRDAAVTAARGWRFEPTVLSGSPARVIGAIAFNFRRDG